MGLVQVREDLCAIDALPVEGIIGELVGVVPSHLGGEEVLHTAALHDLGDSSGITKGIRQPEGIGGKAEVFPGKALAPQELTHHRFAGGDIAVAFHPNAAVRLIAAFGHLFLNTAEQLGIVTADNFTMEGRALHKGVLGILLHQIQLVGVGASTLLNGFAHVPQPSSVHVGVANNAYRGSGRAVMPCQSGGHDLLALFQSSIEFLAADAVGIIVQHFMESQHHIDKFGLTVAGFVQNFHQLIEGAQVEVEVSDLVVLHADIHGSEGEPEIIARVLLKGHATHNIVARIEFQVDLDVLSFLGVLYQHVTVVVAMAGNYDLSGKSAKGFAVHPEQCFIAAYMGL